MSFKTFLSSLMAIGGIAGSIIGLSINHQYQQAKAASTLSPVPSTSSPGGAVGTAVVRPQAFSANDGPFGPAGHCNIERIDGQLFTDKVSRGRTNSIALTGWTVDPATKSVPTNADIRMEQIATHQIWLVPLKTEINRPDVVASQGDESAYLRSGFEVRIGPVGLPEGDYHMLIQYQSGGIMHLCDNGRILHLDG